MQRLFRRYPLMRAEDPVLRGHAVDGAPHGEQRIDRRDRRIGMDRQRHAGCQRGAAGIHPLRARRADGQRAMLLAPVINMVGEQVHAHPKRVHAAKDRLVRHLAMLQRMPMIQPRMCRQRAADHLGGEFAGLIAIGMDMQLNSGPVIRVDDAAKFGRRDVTKARSARRCDSPANAAAR